MTLTWSPTRASYSVLLRHSVTLALPELSSIVISFIAVERPATWRSAVSSSWNQIERGFYCPPTLFGLYEAEQERWFQETSGVTAFQAETTQPAGISEMQRLTVQTHLVAFYDQVGMDCGCNFGSSTLRTMKVINYYSNSLFMDEKPKFSRSLKIQTLK